MGFLEPHGRGRRPVRRDALNTDEPAPDTSRAPVIVVHSLAHAVAALNAAAAAHRLVVLTSAPDAGIYAGAGWFSALLGAAREAVPAAQCAAFLDCGDDAGAAQTAIREGITGIVFTGPPEVAERLADIARRGGIRLMATRATANLDLGMEFFASADGLRQRCAALWQQS
ncbi:MAG TPA: hypothetical protein VHW90_04135 [Stellaceae bacterium]|jgi:hypothetical protein|nr:hypothetical protein [Stellaceae bacterium]